jgi:CRP/FNR family transcriptional regulator, anaerobic regulatory protein
MTIHPGFIESVNRFVHLTEAEVSAILPLMKNCEYQKGQHLTQQGETENYLYFITEGCIRNYTIHNGEEYSLDFYFTGNFTTSYMSFLLREPSTVNVQTMVPSRVLRIHYDDVQFLYSKYKNIETLGRLITESSYVRRTKREFSFITQSAEERYLTLMASHSQIIQDIPQKHIASYLGIKAESLSRIKRALAKRKVQ